MFGYAFAFNALFASFGPSIYIKLSQKIAVEKIITTCFLILMLCGVLTYNIAHLSPFIFAFIAAPATIMVIITRVPGVNLMLNQQKSDTGSLVAIIQFFSMMAGALGMTLVTLRPEALIENVAIIQFSIGTIGCLLWLLVKNKPHVTENIITLK